MLENGPDCIYQNHHLDKNLISLDKTNTKTENGKSNRAVRTENAVGLVSDVLLQHTSHVHVLEVLCLRIQEDRDRGLGDIQRWDGLLGWEQVTVVLLRVRKSARAVQS